MAESAKSKENIYFGVDIDLNNMAVDIRVNDIPVYFDYTKGQLTVEMPAPTVIIDGENELSILGVLPIDTTNYEEGAYVIATLFREDLHLPNAKKVELAKIKIEIVGNDALLTSVDLTANQPHSTKIALAANKEVLKSVTTTIKSPYPRWKWQDASKIESETNHYDTLLAAYSEIHTALKNKELNILKELYKERAIETAIAYNLDGVSAGYDKLSLGEDMIDDRLKLADLHTKRMVFDILGNGRLARISNNLGAQPVVFLDHAVRAYHIHKFMFYLNDKNEWVMIR